MTNDPTRTPDPAIPGQPVPAQPVQPVPTQPVPGAEAWYATPAPVTPGSAQAPSFIPAGIGAKPAPAKATKRGGLLTGALVVAALIAALGVGFAAGRVTSPQQTGTGRGQGFGNGNGNGSGFPNASGRPGNGFGGFAAGSIAVSGSVVAMGNGTITVQPAGGSGTVRIAVPNTTTYHSQGSASSTDVAIGSQVQVTVNRPQFRGGADASGAPAASGNPGAGTNAALTATDILLTGK